MNVTKQLLDVKNIFFWGFTNSNIIGFEPNKDEFIKLEQSSKKKFFNYAIGDGKVHNLNICYSPGMTSVLKPNYEYLKLFHKFDEWSKILKEATKLLPLEE